MNPKRGSFRTKKQIKNDDRKDAYAPSDAAGGEGPFGTDALNVY